MKNTLETRLGIFFALAFIAAIIILELAGGLDLRPGKHVNARFHDIHELKVGDPVKMAGVPIGHVSKVDLQEGQVNVTLKVNSEAEIKTDSKATLKFAGLLGQNFIAVDFGSAGAPKVDSGAVLETAEQPDLGQILQRLDNVAVGVENLTKSFTGDKIDNLFGPITDFVKQNSGPLTATIGNFKIISDNIASGKGSVGKMINDDALYASTLTTVSNLQNTAADIQSMIAEAKLVITNANQIVNNINSGQGTVGKLVKDETLYRETTTAMMNLREILQKVNRGDGSVGKLVNDESLLKNVKLSLQKLDKATESLEDTGPLSVLGTAVNSLF
ncbi:MAG: Mammalian cell entry related domain protein [Verrucomicrobiales bacterium]|nr:Mammalian cell entry related domain protein [Verrucomicrobiales bacterium]